MDLLGRTDPWGISGFLFLGSWLLMFLFGAPMIRWLRDKRWRKDVQTQAEAWQVREDTPETHQKKQGTPSMGGLGIIGVACAVFTASYLSGLALSTQIGNLFFYWPDLILLFLLPTVTAAHAVLGFADDWSKASGRGGLRARAKLFGQIGLGIVFLGGVWCLNEAYKGQSASPELIFKIPSSLLLAMCIWGVLLICLVGTCNAVNLTDGIDGLAAGLAIQAGIAFFLIKNDSPLFGESAVLFWAALAGSCLGFLAFNKYPAKVFMGDTGSLALGAAVGAGAIMCHAVFLLPFIAFIYFVEMFSVTLQVLYFKYTRRKFGEGRRIFRRAPLHHHFELGGWSEWRVVGTFWAINLVTSAIGLILWHLKVLPRFP